MTSLQREIAIAIVEQTQNLEESLMVLRDENVVLESERNPQFKGRVERELEIARRTLSKALSAVESSS